MIPKRGIREFLARPLKDFSKYKDFTDKELQRRCDLLPVRPPIWKKLLRHQKVCFIAGAETGRFAYWCDTGTGKTCLSIALILYFAKLKRNKRVIVLVPNKINKAEWAREIQKHSPTTNYAVLRGSSLDKWKQLEETKALIVIDTYYGLMRMTTDLVEPKRKSKKKHKLQPSKIQLKRLMKCIDGLILDESTSAKSRGKLPFRICWQISKQVGMVYALSGTPFGRDPMDLWGQMYLVDKGETLGKTLGLFRESFFMAKQNYWGGFDYTIDKRKMGLLNRILSNCSIRIIADKADLPKVVPIVKEIGLPMDAKTYYKRAYEQLVASKGNFRETKNAFLRLRQISSGFLGYADDELGIRAQMEFPDNPKLDLLLSTIESIPIEDKILVFHDFVFSGSIISRELDAMGIKHVRLHRNTKDPAVLLKQFDSDAKTQVFILSTAGAFGLNLQKSKYGLFFERPLSAIMFKQMMRRFERQYSLHKTVFQYDFVVKRTVDEDIIAFHKEGKSYFDAIIEGQAKL